MSHTSTPHLAAVALAALACGGGDLVLPGSTGPASELLKMAGDEQSARAGAELPGSLVVRLVDQQGNGVPAGAVTWVVGAGGGTVSPATATTDERGMVSARWTLGPSPGPNSANAVVSGVDVVTFTASATGGGGGGRGPGPDHLLFQVQPSDARKGERITPAVVVAVLDREGNLVRDEKVKIQLELVAGSGNLGGKEEMDTRDGVATFDDLKVDEAGEGKVLRALAPDDSYLGTVESEAFTIQED